MSSSTCGSMWYRRITTASSLIIGNSNARTKCLKYWDRLTNHRLRRAETRSRSWNRHTSRLGENLICPTVGNPGYDIAGCGLHSLVLKKYTKWPCESLQMCKHFSQCCCACSHGIVRNVSGLDRMFYVLQYSCLHVGCTACQCHGFICMDTYADIIYACGASADIRHDCHRFRPRHHHLNHFKQ